MSADDRRKAIVAALVIVPLEWTADRMTSGWWILLAYPRLYAAWLLWWACVKDLLRNKRSWAPAARQC